MIYLDNAATSWPKPPEVMRAMADFMDLAGGNPGRSGHRLSIAAARVVYNVRETVADFFRAPDPLRVIFTSNATEAINLVLKGLLHSGDGVITTGIEHNAVMRPLRALEKQGVKLTVAPCKSDGTLDPAEISRAILPGTCLVVINHASNVTGTLLPIAEIASIAHQKGALILVDAAQTAGVIPIDVHSWGIDFLAFTGHKGLYGPPGIGGLVIGESVDTSTLEPLVRGGTGSFSEYEEQPADMPDKYESGTPNGVGIAGLGAGMNWLAGRGIGAAYAHEMELARILREGLECIAGVKVYGPLDPALRTGVLSFILEGHRVSGIGLQLDEDFDILCRVGLHCAPAAHKTIHTFPEGTVRFAPSLFTSKEDILAAITAVEQIARK